MRTSMKNGKSGSDRNGAAASAQGRKNPAQTTDAVLAMRILAQTYEQVGDHLLDHLHDCAHDRRRARSLSRHLDWVGSRARVINSFIEAGDGALHYLCQESDAPERLASLVQLTAHNVAAGDRLPVVLFLMEKIDEELHLG